ncbi:MAG: ComF family protein [Coriobacteriia bacterium]|nr:ComF family protein [Coriobacteriia bacterium]
MGGILDLIFPPRCAGCDRPGTLLCDACRGTLPLIDPGSACARCGAPMLGASGPCAECRGRAFAFSVARCAARLEPPVSRAVVMLKDSGERRYAAVLAELLATAADGWLAPGAVLVPAPASPAAVRRRGFDHAADITRALGRLTGAEVQCLLRATGSADQRALGREARFANRATAFRLAGPREIAAGASLPERVVLVDDVFTTGATLDAAARVLRGAGVAEVRALAVARACEHVACVSVSERIQSEGASLD